jgi:hypothetical protein
VLAHRTYPNNPASLIQHTSARADGNSGCDPDRRTNVRIQFFPLNLRLARPVDTPLCKMYV